VATYYSSNFDADTTGTLPSGWANIGTADYEVTTSGAVSGTKALGPTAGDGTVALYTGDSARQDSAVQIAQIVKSTNAVGSSSNPYASINPVLRADSSFNNSYMVLLGLAASEGAYGGVYVFTRVGGEYTALGGAAIALPQNYFAGRNLQNGDTLLFKAECTGSSPTTVRWKLWLAGESEPGSWTGSITDSTSSLQSVTGYSGLYSGRNNSYSAQPSADDFYLGSVGATFPEPPADTTAPTVTGATLAANGTTLTIVLSESGTTGAGGNGGFALTASGGAVTLSYASGSGSGTLVFTASRTILSGETLSLAYTQPGNGWEDAAGNDLATFTGQAVTNSSTQTGAVVIDDSDAAFLWSPYSWRT
jgi:hypothetical protein